MNLAPPRLLPITIVLMGALLATKSTMLVRAAVPAAEGAPAAPPKGGEHAAAAAKPRPEPAAAAAKAAAPAAAVPAAPPALPPPAPPVSDAERAVLINLRQRRVELEAREQAMTLREQVQAAAEQRLGARLDELSSLQHRIEQLDATRHAHDEANWRAMVKLYESMKPRDAAAIFNDLDRSVLLQIVDRMAERRAAMVMAAMQPERARELTAALAEMRTKSVTLPDAAPPGLAPEPSRSDPLKPAGKS